ncbi:MAG: hypothetical protein QMB08_00655, partial [Acidimicrobiales bacterium]
RFGGTRASARRGLFVCLRGFLAGFLVEPSTGSPAGRTGFVSYDEPLTRSRFLNEYRLRLSETEQSL